MQLKAAGPTLSFFLLLVQSTRLLKQMNDDWICFHIRMGFAWLFVKVGPREEGRLPTAGTIPVRTLKNASRKTSDIP